MQGYYGNIGPEKNRKFEIDTWIIELCVWIIDLISPKIGGPSIGVSTTCTIRTMICWVLEEAAIIKGCTLGLYASASTPPPPPQWSPMSMI